MIPAPPPRLSRRGSQALCAGAVLLAAFGGATRAQDAAPSRIVVDGRPVAATAGMPRLVDGRLFVPLWGIAAELGDAVEVDSATQSITVRLNHTGETRAFSRLSGEVRSDGAVIAVVSDVAGVVVSATPDSQQLPLSLLALLLDVSVQVDGAAGVISVRRERVTALQAVAGAKRLPVELTRADYFESVTLGRDTWGHRFDVGAQAALYDGGLSGRLEFSGAEGEPAYSLMGGWATLARPNGQSLTAGDYALARGWRLISAPARGLAVEQPVGRDRLQFYAGAALSETRSGAGGFTVRRFDTDTAGFLWTHPLGAGPRDPALGLGGLYFSGAEGEGLMLAQKFSWRRPHNWLQFDAAAGRFCVSNAAAETGECVGDEKSDWGLDISDTITLGRQTLVVRASHFGEAFITPQVNNSLRARDDASLSWSGPLAPGLSAGAGVSWTRVLVGARETTRTAAASMNFAHPTRALPEISLSGTVSDGDGTYDTTILQASAAQVIGRWRPFVSWTRIGDDPSATETATLGASVNMGGAGTLQAYESFAQGDANSGFVDWTSRPMLNGRLIASLGAGYIEGAYGPAGAWETKFSTRGAVSAQILGGQFVTVNYQNTGLDRQVVITLTGPFFARAPRATAPPGPGRGPIPFPGRIVGRLYQDANLNGQFEPLVDAPLAGVRLWLDGAWLAETDDQGEYLFDAVSPGAHKLRVDFATVRADLTALGVLEDSVDLPDRVELRRDFHFARTGALVGVVWFDRDRDGEFDPGESPAGDVRLICSCGADTLSNSDGGFILGDLLPGLVSVTVDLLTIPPGFAPRPARLDVEVLPGRQTHGLRIALRPVEREIQLQTAQTASLATGASQQ